MGSTLRILARLLAPWRTIRKLERENKRLSDAIANPLMTGMEIGRERGIEVGMKGSGPELLAGMFLGWLEQDGKNAPNYLEMTFESPRGRILVTVTQPNGATPHQLRQQAEQRVRQLEAELLQVQGDPEAHF